MKSFALNEKNDIIFSRMSGNMITDRGKQIQLAKDNEIIAQKILIRLGTVKGEWFWDNEFGIDFDYIIGKNITEDMIKSQIQLGINQVDSSFYLSDFKVEIDKRKRTSVIDFTVSSNGEKIVKIEKTYGAEQSNTADKLEAANAKITVYESSLSRLQNRLNGK